MAELTKLVGGVDFGEGPRWHDDRLWYSDFYQRAVYAVASDGTRTTVHDEFTDRPSGMGWLPDGSHVVVSMVERKLLRSTDGGTYLEFADLSMLAEWHCNDLVIAENGDIYVGNFGFDLEGGGEMAGASLLLVRPDGSASVAASDLAFPNGSVITPDGSTLIVGQSFGADYIAFTIGADGSLTDRRQWAAVPGMAPDGCSLDAAGGIWFADAVGSQVVRVEEGGAITHTVATPMPTYACALGGEDGKTLFVLCAPGSHPDEVAGKAAGAIFTMPVRHAHAGLP